MRSFKELESIMNVFATKSNAIHNHVHSRYTDYFFTLFIDSDWKEFAESLVHEELMLLAKSKTFRARLLIAEYPKNDGVLELLLADPDEKVRKVTRDNKEKSEEERKKSYERNKEHY